MVTSVKEIRIDEVLVKTKDTINIVFAAAPSQNEFLSYLNEEDIPWSRINTFHMVVLRV